MSLGNHETCPSGAEQHLATAVIPENEILSSSLGGTAVGALAPPEVGAPGLSEDAYSKLHDPDTLEVHVQSRVTIEDYEAITPSEDMERLKNYAKEMEGKEIIFVNATAAGGGVAIMRAPLVHLLNSLGVKARWFALRPDEEKKFFDVTKQKFHNVLQDVAKPGTRLTEEDKELYHEVINENAEALREPLSSADVIVIDDWQPSGLIPHLKGGSITTSQGIEQREGLNPDAIIIFRDHIHTEGELMGTPGTPQHTTWEFIWKNNRVNEADAFVVHPKDEFVPPDVPDEKVVFMPATADLLDDLNRPLSPVELEEGRDFINGQLASNENQKPLDLSRPYIVLIARFDPSKGMPQGMEAYAKARSKMHEEGVQENQLPQLVVLGNGSIDDPDGIPLLEEMMRLRREVYDTIKDDIKVARVPHNDRAINALLKGATLALQPSTKEGFESRVTDAILQGVPVIGSDRGGIPLQIAEGKSGYVADPHDTDRWANLMSEFVTDVPKYESLRKSTAELAISNNYRFTTIPNALRWLGLSLELRKNPDFEGNRKSVEELTS